MKDGKNSTALCPIRLSIRMWFGGDSMKTAIIKFLRSMAKAMITAHAAQFSF